MCFSEIDWSAAEIAPRLCFDDTRTLYRSPYPKGIGERKCLDAEGLAQSCSRHLDEPVNDNENQVWFLNRGSMSKEVKGIDSSAYSHDITRFRSDCWCFLRGAHTN